MKLASLKSGRDGQLVVVSRDLSKAIPVPHITATLQGALDRWTAVSDQLQQVYERLNLDTIDGAFEFDQGNCAAPLPRSYQWADASAYVNHVELVRRARGAELPDSFWQEPLMYQGGSDDFLGPQQDIPFVDESWGLDFEAEVAVITDDVAIGTTADQALSHVKLLMLVNDVSLRGLIPAELVKGFGFFQSKPATSFSPVAVTPDELGDRWQTGKLSLPLLSTLNGSAFGKPNAGADMTFHFGQLIAHAAKTRNLGSGCVVGSGTVSNKQGMDFGTSIDQGGVGYSCIAEIRMIETIRDGAPATRFMQPGDRINIEMLDQAGHSIFGAIHQKVVEAS